MNFVNLLSNQLDRKKKLWILRQVQYWSYLGTTTLAFVFKEGVLMAVDSRATMGNFISS